MNKTFRHVDTLFVQGRNLYLAGLLLVIQGLFTFRQPIAGLQGTDFYLGRIKFLHVERPYSSFMRQLSKSRLENLTLAVRDAGVFRNNGDRKTMVLWCTRGFEGPSIEPPWCRGTIAPRTAIFTLLTDLLNYIKTWEHLGSLTWCDHIRTWCVLTHRQIQLWILLN